MIFKSKFSQNPEPLQFICIKYIKEAEPANFAEGNRIYARSVASEASSEVKHQ